MVKRSWLVSTLPSRARHIHSSTASWADLIGVSRKRESNEEVKESGIDVIIRKDNDLEACMGQRQASRGHWVPIRSRLKKMDSE